MKPSHRKSLGLALWLGTCAPREARADALGLAAQAEAQKDWPAAHVALEAVRAQLPGDYEVAMRCGLAALRVQAWADAQRAYAAAMRASDGGREARLGLADALAGAGERRQALALLDALLAEEPGAGGVRERRRALRLADGDLDGAEADGRALLQAADRADARAAAQVGLAQVAWARGDRSEARAQLQGALVDDPLSDAARAQLDGLGSGVGATASALTYGAATTLGGQAQASVGVGLGLDAALGDHLRLGLHAKRESSLSLQSSASGSPPPLGFDQTQGQARLGYEASSWGLAAHLGLVHTHEEAGPQVLLDDTAWMAAASGHLHLLGVELSGSAAYSAYSDGGVAQAELGVTVPIFRFLSLYGGARTQRWNGSFSPSAQGELVLHGEAWRLAAGGSWGTEVRPVDLATSSIYASTDAMPWRAHAAAGVELGHGLSLTLAYELERTTVALDAKQSEDALTQRLSLGLGFSF
jgi:tetratricopeptide (TPR) repeat protein